MATTTPVKRGAPTGEMSIANPNVVPTWEALGRSVLGIGTQISREYVPELRWPQSVGTVGQMGTYERMRNDTQLSGLLRATTLPIRRYVWGIDPNGAPPKVVDQLCRDFNVPTIDQAWQEHETGKSSPRARERGTFRLDKHLEDLFAALQYGHMYFELVGEIGDDLLWHPEKVAPIAPWTIGRFDITPVGDLVAIRQSIGLQAPLIPAERLVPYVSEKTAGDWVGRSLFRSCYREWLLKDLLLRIDLENHDKAGGIVINEAPEGATPEEITALAQLAANARVGTGSAVPAGTNPIFIRGTGSDVIASVNRHDESMTREFLAMFMSLGTASSGGNRAMSGSFIDWFSIAQETEAIWARDIFNEHILVPYVNWNWGEQIDYVPRLVFKRPEAENPLNTLKQATETTPGDPVQLAYRTPDGELLDVGKTRLGPKGVIYVGEEIRDAIVTAHALWERDAHPSPRRARAAVDPATALPDRPLRREPNAHEVLSAADFKKIDENWQSQVDQLVSEWQTIRETQIAELAQLIAAGGGDLTELAQIAATASGGDLIAARLKAMAQLGSLEAQSEATKQGVTATAPDLAALEAQLEARASALEQLLASSISQAAANKAVQLSGGGLDPSEVSGQVGSYLSGLTDTYLADQFAGALSAAQNAGRLAVMDENGAKSYYASELLDTNTCDPCEEIDGTEYATAAEASADYPAGGYRDCAGGPRCRGTVVAVYAEAEPSSGGDV